MSTNFTPLRTLNGFVVTQRGRILDETFDRYKLGCMMRTKSYLGFSGTAWDALAANRGLKIMHARISIGQEATARHGNTGRKRAAVKGGG